MESEGGDASKIDAMVEDNKRDKVLEGKMCSVFFPYFEHEHFVLLFCFCKGSHFDFFGQKEIAGNKNRKKREREKSDW